MIYLLLYYRVELKMFCIETLSGQVVPKIKIIIFLFYQDINSDGF